MNTAAAEASPNLKCWNASRYTWLLISIVDVPGPPFVRIDAKLKCLNQATVSSNSVTEKTGISDGIVIYLNAEIPVHPSIAPAS